MGHRKTVKKTTSYSELEKVCLWTTNLYYFHSKASRRLPIFFCKVGFILPGHSSIE